MVDAMREMGFEGELLVSTGSPPEIASTLGDIAPKCFKAWASCECMVCSGAVQCHVLMRARVVARGIAPTSRNSHAKEGSEPLQGVRPGERVHVSKGAWGAVCAIIQGCALSSKHWVV
jgi:hypothetical protein